MDLGLYGQNLGSGVKICSSGARVLGSGAKIRGYGAKIGDSGVKIVALVRPTQFFLSYFDPWGLLWSPLRGP